MEEPTVKELRSDDNDPLFDKTNMLKKEFPSDFRQIRYFTLLIVQSAPSEIKELNLLEQQISEVIKNAVKHGNHCDINKKVTVWYSFSPTHAHVIVLDEGEGFKDLEKWNEFNRKRISCLHANNYEELANYVSFKTKESVLEISTCVFLRTGPKTRTFSIDLSDGPIIVTNSSEANSLPIRTFLTVSS